MRRIDYASPEDKAVRYVAETLPAMAEFAAKAARGGGSDYYALRMWLVNDVFDFRAARRDVHSLKIVHGLVRARRYVGDPVGPFDYVKDVHETLVMGGDCEDYAILVAAAADLMGYPWQFVTAGFARDHFAHAYTEVFAEGRWWALDAKGNQEGEAFGYSSPGFEVRRRFAPANAEGVGIVEVTA